MSMTKTPFLPTHLTDEEVQEKDDWHEKMLLELAKQLGVANDFYYPLRGAAQEITSLRRLRDGLVEIVRALNPYTNKPTVSSTERERT